MDSNPNSIYPNIKSVSQVSTVIQCFFRRILMCYNKMNLMRARTIKIVNFLREAKESERGKLSKLVCKMAGK